MANTNKKNVLVLVEGEKTDVALMQKLFRTYTELDANYRIVPYRTNIYVLYNEVFEAMDEKEDMDLLLALRAREPDISKKKLLDDKYSDIILVFDLDPQDPQFSAEKIRRMQTYFCMSSDMGKLYLNYPMVESFYHMPTIPDHGFMSRTVQMEELISGSYKARVGHESFGHDYRKFAATRAEMNYVVSENAKKALTLAGEGGNGWSEIDYSAVLESQLEWLLKNDLQVLCTCVLYVYDYNRRLLSD